MTATLSNIILSILKTKDAEFISHKINIIESQLDINDVEKQIIKDINDSLVLDSIPSESFIKEKYSFYTDTDDLLPPEAIPRDAIDSAIVELKIEQNKLQLAKELSSLSGKVNKMSSQEIKEQVSKLHNNVLLTTKHDLPENKLVIKDDAYGEMTELSKGLSLVIPKIEHFAGKATPGTMVSILAYTGSYKTAYSLQIAYENALQGHNILYLALEDTAEKLITRLVLSHLAYTKDEQDDLIEASILKEKKLTKHQEKIYNAAHNDLIVKLNNRLILWEAKDIDYNTMLGMSETLKMADEEFITNTGSGIDAIIIDSVSLLKYTAGTGRKPSYDGAIINDWISYFREQALNFLDSGRKIVVFPLSQVSRNAFAEASKPRKKGRYDAACASDAHEIERSSTTMITLFVDTDTRNTLLVNIPKAREGYQPEHPLQIEVYGEYNHIGPLKCQYVDIDISADSFDDMSIEELIKS